MLSALTDQQTRSYQDRGFLILPEFLSKSELSDWREVIDRAVAAHVAGRPVPDELTADRKYYRNVFTQCVNLWKTDPDVERLVVDQRLGKLAAQISGSTGTRLYHDHALIKEPWANPTNFHVDNPYDPYHTDRATMIWVALDDTTIQNGCLYLLPGTHKDSHFKLGGNLSQASIGDLFQEYPHWADIEPVPAEMKAGDAIFISGLVAHAAGPNMTTSRRRAFAILFMPEDAVFNGEHSALPDEVVDRLAKGDLLADDRHLPLLYSNKDEPT